MLSTFAKFTLKKAKKNTISVRVCPCFSPFASRVRRTILTHNTHTITYVYVLFQSTREIFCAHVNPLRFYFSHSQPYSASEAQLHAISAYKGASFVRSLLRIPAR